MVKLTAIQENMLKAALLSGPAAISAWDFVESEIDINYVDESSHRLIPLAIHNLEANGVSKNQLEPYQRVSRFYWYKSQLIISKATSLLETLHHGGVQTLLLKGVPLALSIYPKTMLRPFGDLDILVKKHQITQAVNNIQDAGYLPYGQGLHPYTFEIRHSVPFRNKEGLSIDLHGRVLYLSWNSFQDSTFWDDGVPININGHITRTLSPTDHLLHVCLHGAFDSRNCCWIADAAMILRSNEEIIDWDRIANLASELRLSVQLSNQFGYLRDIINVTSIENVIEKLNSNKKWRYEVFEIKNNNASPNVIQKTISFWLRYHRLVDMHFFRRMFTFPLFLYRSWSWFALLFSLPKKVIGKLVR